MNEKILNLLNVLRSNKKPVAIVLIIVFVIIALVLYFSIKNKHSLSTDNKIILTQKKQATQIKASLVTIQGTVETNLPGEEKWSSAGGKQEVLVGSSVRTQGNSSVVVSFEDGDLLAMESSSQIKIIALLSSEIIVEQISGKSYAKVEKKEGKTFSILSSDVKATALGTEFSVSGKADEVIEVLVFKSSVQAEYSGKIARIEEMYKFSFNAKAGQYTKLPISDNEKKLGDNYVGLIQKASEALATVEQPATNTEPTVSTTPKKPTTANSTSAGVSSNTSGSSTASLDQSTNSNNSSSNNSTDSSSASNGSSNATSDSASNQSSSQSSTTETNIFGQYSDTSIDDILSALALVFDDGIGDFTQPGGGAPPTGIYNYSPIDLDNLSMGVRDGRLYIKWSLDGELPTTRQTIDGNTIESLTYNIKISDDENPDSSNACNGTDVFMQINIAYHSDGQIWYNPWYSAICTNTAPYNSDDDWKFQNTGNGQAHTYSSGIGKKSVAYSFALSDLGSALNVGSNVKIEFYSEAESDTYHHYSFEGNTDASGQRVWREWTVTEI